MGADTPATAERIRSAAIRLWAERGFHGTGIRDLATAAGLSSATLYHYMGTKQDLLAEIMRTSLERLLETARQTLTATADPADRLAALVRLHVLTHARRPQETRVVDGEMRALPPGHRAAVVAVRDQYESLWQQAIDDGCAAGAFRSAAPRVARLALLEMCNGVAHWYDADGPLSLDELAQRHVEMAFGLLGHSGTTP